MTARTVKLDRKTGETTVSVALNIDGKGEAEVHTGVGFFDHMLVCLARHSGMDMVVTCKGDTHVDDHHTVEDCAIVLGQALDQALGDKTGIVRFADALAPLDESLARVAVDLSGRACAVIDLPLSGDRVGDMSTQNVSHVLEAFAVNAKMTLHVDVLRGHNDHHMAEAAFKALALSLRQAVRRRSSEGIPSTKGVL